MKKNKILLAIVIVVAALALIFTVVEISGMGKSDTKVEIGIKNGDTFSSIAGYLKDKGLIGNKTLFKLYVKLTGKNSLKTGTYMLSPSMGYGTLTYSLQNCANLMQYKVLIKEGYVISEIADELEKAGLINREVFIHLAESGNFDFDFVKKIERTEHKLEGYLFPDTYLFSKQETEADIISHMLENFEKNVIPLYEKSGTDMSLDDVVKLASVVEKEAANEEEKPKIASVFLNRLKIGKKLESDATLQYTYSEKKEELSLNDINKDNPYNTYLNTGLQYSPIAAPGFSSIKAVLYPENTDYLYFIAAPDGTHSVFSKDFDTHSQYQKEFEKEK